MSAGIFTTPRPVPGRLAGTLAGGAVIGLALPVIALAGWSIRGWGLAAVLWAAAQVFALILARLPLGTGNLAAAGMRGIGTGFRAFLIGVPLVAVTVADERLGITAALVYVVAYSTELAVSILAYLGGEARA